MKRIVSLLFAMIIFLSACASPAVSTPAPAEQVEATSAAQPAEEVAPVENTATATFTPEPTTSPTPEPPPARWYWSVDPNTAKVIAVNQFGDRNEIGELANEDYFSAVATPIDNERALLFLDNDDTLRGYLLTPDNMQKIEFPSESNYLNADISQSTRAVVAAHENYAVFTYGQAMGEIGTGPVFLVDLKSLTADLIDKEGNRDSFDANRKWFHSSKDGRYLRYINGNPDVDKMEIRELDLVTGEARTIYSTNSSPARIYSSPEGDLWYLKAENIIVDLNGNQTDGTDKEHMTSPLKDGKVLVYPWDCVDACEMKVTTPFGMDTALTYNLPWTIEGATSYAVVRQVLPDQNLLFAGLSYSALSNTPAIIETYPDLTELDIPLFRLTPDGQARLVGSYVEGAFTDLVSADGRYIFMESTDHTSFFIYDALADRQLFDMPIDAGLEDYLATIRFLDGGIIVNLSASVPDTKHSVNQNFYYSYDFKTSTIQAWEDINAEINTCSDILEDGTLVCWFYRTDTPNADLVRYDPATGTKTVLLEDAWSIESIP